MISVDHTKAPSTLGELIGTIKGMFEQAADKTPIQVGEQYLTASHGTPPKIVFLPEFGNGKLGPPLSLGHAAASWAHSCEVRVRAKPGLEEENVFCYATSLADKVIAALAVAASGRLEWGAVTQTSPTASNSMGAEITFSFVYRRNVPHWEKLWNLPTPQDDGVAIDNTRTLARYTPAAQPTITAPEGFPIVTPTTIPREG
jgi:hypothetical protein